MKPRKAFTLVEILIVLGIMSVVFILGYRTLRTVTSTAVQINQAGANPRKAEYDRLVGVLNDRLSQAWGYNLVTASYNGLPGSELHLVDASGTDVSIWGVYYAGAAYIFRLQDAGGPALSLTYGFTNLTATDAYALTLSTNSFDGVHYRTYVNWKIPPPLYYSASDDAFTGVFLATSPADLSAQVWEHRTNSTGLLQHDLKSYSWNPQQDSFR